VPSVWPTARGWRSDLGIMEAKSVGEIQSAERIKLFVFHEQKYRQYRETLIIHRKAEEWKFFD
jgi:hypothetical protein